MRVVMKLQSVAPWLHVHLVALQPRIPDDHVNPDIRIMNSDGGLPWPRNGPPILCLCRHLELQCGFTLTSAQGFSTGCLQCQRSARLNEAMLRECIRSDQAHLCSCVDQCLQLSAHIPSPHTQLDEHLVTAATIFHPTDHERLLLRVEVWLKNDLPHLVRCGWA